MAIQRAKPQTIFKTEHYLHKLFDLEPSTMAKCTAMFVMMLMVSNYLQLSLPAASFKFACIGIPMHPLDGCACTLGRLRMHLRLLFYQQPRISLIALALRCLGRLRMHHVDVIAVSANLKPKADVGLCYLQVAGHIALVHGRDTPKNRHLLQSSKSSIQLASWHCMYAYVSPYVRILSLCMSHF